VINVRSFAACSSLAAIQALAAPAVVSVKQFGAQGDCKHVSDGSITRNSFKLTSASATFTSADVGKAIYILDAGDSTYQGREVRYGNLPLDTTIAQVVDRHAVLVRKAALNSVTGVSTTWGTDDSEAIQRAIDSVAASGGGTIFFPAGMFRVTNHFPGGFGMGFKLNASNLRLTGEGDQSKIFNSSVSSFMTTGTTYYHETGVTVFYAGSSTPISNVEIDHLWFGDNGQHFNFIVASAKGTVTNPEGPGVIGTVGIVNDLRLHDLTIVTSDLCGISTDAQESTGVVIDHVKVQSNGGNHGLYLGGQKTFLTVSNSSITSQTTPMRIGVVVKRGSHILIRNNRISNVAQQGVGIDANSEQQLVQDVTVVGNVISNDPDGPLPFNLLPPGAAKSVNTHGIQVNNGTHIAIRNNTITGMNYSGIYIGADLWPISDVSIENNFISKTQTGIVITAQLLAGSLGKASSDLLRDVSITSNTVTDSLVGLYEYQVGGNNRVAGNCIHGGEREGSRTTFLECGVSFDLREMIAAKVTFSNNTAANCTRFHVPDELLSDRSNDLRTESAHCAVPAAIH
jgi:hypothetical protein